MSLTDALSIATTGLNATQYALSIASQNVANANTPGYSAEVANVSSMDVAGRGIGVRAGPTTLATNTVLTSALYSQNANVASLQTSSNALATITALQGSTATDAGSSGSLPDALGNLRNALTTLTSTPSSTASQSTAIANASTIVQTLHTLGNAYQTGRQNAQTGIVNSLATVNTDLTTIGALSTQIMSLTAAGADTADLQNQRNAAVSDLSSQLSIKTQATPNGDLTITTADGTTLPTHTTNASGSPIVSSTWPLTTQDVTVTSASAYPDGNGTAIPGIMLGGRDVTQSLTGGTLGANITLRDTTFPTMQAQLDSFSSSLAIRFQTAGLPLFTTASGTTPGSDPTTPAPAGSVGLSQQLSVNPSFTGDPSLLVNGTGLSTASVTQSLATGFGSNLISAPTSGLGLSGQLSTGYRGNSDIITLATSMTANQAATASAATTGLASAQTTQASLAAKVSSATGVSVDQEMSHVVTLQNAYAANAKIVSTVQAMFSDLMNAFNG